MLESSQSPHPTNLPLRVQHFDTLPDSALMNVGEVSLLSGKSIATLWRDVQAERIAHPIKVGPNSTRWRVGDVRRFLEGGE